MAPTPPFSPALLAGYGPLTFLGEDDTGPAWTAVQRESGTPVVLRALTQLPGDEVERVLAAARALERLEHLGLARVRACGRDGEVPYLIVEAVDGEPLRERLARARPTAEETLAAGEWLAEALAAAHGAGIVHGSVSPETIVAMGLGAVKLVDAGLRARGPEAYRSPEVCDGQPATPASEQYALGTVLYEMIAGCSPFDADGNVRPLADVVPGIDAGVAICLESALARDPKERFASMDEMREGLAIAHARLTGLPPMARIAVVRAAQAFVPPAAATRRALVSAPDTSSTSPSTIHPSGRIRPRAGIKIPR